MRVLSLAAVLFVLAASASVASLPYTDADILALEISDSLLAPVGMVSQISQDIAAIHAAYPGWVHGVDYVHAQPDWLPGEIIVQMTTQGWTDYQNGVFTALNNLNAQYGPVTIGPIALPRTIIVYFPVLYNPALMSSIYAQAAGIAIAQPNYLYGSGSDITSSAVGRYLFKRVWFEPSGSYGHYWDFEVIDGSVTLLAEWGSPTLAGVGDTPTLPVRLMGNVPNPFDNATDVAYEVERATDVQLRIYDAGGRLVKNLHNGPASRGSHTARWDGTDQTGRRVASGVYFCNLVAGDITQTRKMVVIR